MRNDIKTIAQKRSVPKIWKIHKWTQYWPAIYWPVSQIERDIYNYINIWDYDFKLGLQNLRVVGFHLGVTERVHLISGYGHFQLTSKVLL